LRGRDHLSPLCTRSSSSIRFKFARDRSFCSPAILASLAQCRITIHAAESTETTVLTQAAMTLTSVVVMSIVVAIRLRHAAAQVSKLLIGPIGTRENLIDFRTLPGREVIAHLRAGEHGLKALNDHSDVRHGELLVVG
jgi:hypothetical protein